MWIFIHDSIHDPRPRMPKNAQDHLSLRKISKKSPKCYEDLSADLCSESAVCQAEEEEKAELAPPEAMGPGPAVCAENARSARSARCVSDHI